MGRSATATVGSAAEKQALRYLKRHGLRLVTKNYQSRGGEIDLIMMDGNCLAFIEVRYRASASFAHASHTVDLRKQNKIIRTAALFLAQHTQFANHVMRFDIVAIEGTHRDDLCYLKDAFRPSHSTY